MNYHTYFDTLIGLLGAFLSFFIGGLDSLITVFIILVGCDMVTGFMKGIILKRLSSEIGFRGIAKKVCMFMIVGVANVLGKEMLGQSDVLRDGVIMFYLASEGISILENAIDMGAPVPEGIKELFLSWRNKQLISKNKPDIEDR
ncbi:MAG: phage holin family protein [Synergistaceae bacterium]|nr:phage holin family protein [Synergistaceae bacterium]